MQGALIFIIAGVAGYGLGFPVYGQLVRWNALDYPNSRSSHDRPTARGAGVAIIITILLITLSLPEAWSARQTLALLAAALVLAGVSLVDDLKSVSAFWRLGCHAAAAITWLVTLGWPRIGGGSALEFGWIDLFGGLLMLFWLAGYTNAFNFMDGINGLAAGQAVVTGIGTAVIATLGAGGATEFPVLLSFLLAGAALGFLPHNFPRARMFMGDVGSAPLGFLLAALALWIVVEYGWQFAVPLFLLHANFVLDTAITLARRVLRGERWHEAHREHFYQRLVRAGKSHTFVTGLEMGLQAIVLALMVCYLFGGTAVRVCTASLVLGLWLSFFVYCEAAFRKSGDRNNSISSL